MIIMLPVAAMTGCAGSAVLPASTPTVSPLWTLNSTPPNIPPSPSSDLALTSTPDPLPTLTPTPFSQVRSTPMTLMLHPATGNFDPVAFLQGFIALLQESDIKVVTYRDILADPGITAREQGKLAIITLDDVYLQSPLNYSVERMISLLQEADFPAVLGVVTQGSAPNTDTAGTLKRLAEAGWEIATHSDTHPYLGQLERSSPPLVSLQIKTSQDKIESAVGVRPVTLVLPYGQNIYDMGLAGNEGIVWVVGIGGGNTYDSTRDIYFVGREGPDGTPKTTFAVMMRRFNPTPQLP